MNVKTFDEILGFVIPDFSAAVIDLLAILKTNVDRMCTIAIEALTPLYRTSRIKLYKNNARSRLFCRIAKRSVFLRIQFY